MSDATPEAFASFVRTMRDAGELGPLEWGPFKVGATSALTASPPITEAQRSEMLRQTREQAEALLYASSEGFPAEKGES